MQTRRQLLEGALSVSLAPRVIAKRAQVPALQIICDSECLSQESAEGFRSLLLETRGITVLCGVSRVSAERAFRLRERAVSGGSIVWEISPFSTAEQRHVLHETFGMMTRDPITLSTDHLYVRYSWPSPALIRAFSAVIPVVCTPNEVIARYCGIPVAMRRRIGRGGLVFLGSMLGPNLRAEEREARDVALRMLNFQE
jgi:hypothetical protein